jgi:peptide-methionine (S)-S-oxide reductase
MKSRLTSVLIACLALRCASAHASPDLPKPSTDLPAAKAGEKRTAVFAGGCFWCMEAVFEELSGVTDVVSGFAGGTKETAIYERVSSGGTSHAEAVQVTYDPSKVSFAQLIQVFFTMHDPTTKDRQGPDWGHQYRSAFFYQSAEEKSVVDSYIKQLEAAKVFSSPIVTTLEPFEGFYPADAHHQDFVRLHPDHPYVRQWALPKLQKEHQKFPSLTKPRA